jgi:Ser/Thr protein kinase RdoA (MazF antagonist)
MGVSVFPVNGPLPTLVDATDAQRMAEVLHASLGGDRAELAGIDLVRFRRTGGCVLRYRLEPDGGGPAVYGKIGYAAAGEVVRDGLQALAARAVPLTDRPIVYPQVLGSSAELDLVLVAEVPGVRPDLRNAAALDATVESAALVAATIHTSGVPVGAPHTLEDEVARSRRAVARIAGDAPALAAWLSGVLDSVATLARAMPAQPPALAHGDLTPSQLLLDGDRLGILDFDGLCQAEPAFDLGRFLAYLRMALARSGSPAAGLLATRLLGAYHEVGGRPVPEDRAEVYAVLSLVQTAAHCWQQLKPARLRLVCTVLERQAL